VDVRSTFVVHRKAELYLKAIDYAFELVTPIAFVVVKQDGRDKFENP
jgi:hypothetical protein